MARTEKKPEIFHQILGAVAASLSFASLGAGIGVTSVLIYSLSASKDPDIELTLELASWIPTCKILGTACGSFAGGAISASLGRRRTMALFSAPVVVAWLLMGFSTEAWMIYVANFAIGFFAGIPYVNVGVYISEVVHKSKRSQFGALQAVFLVIGIIVAQTCGYIFPWRTAAKILAAIPLVSAVAILLFPETPYWLIENGRDEEARKSLAFYRGNNFAGLEEELSEIVAARKLKASSETSQEGKHGIMDRISFFIGRLSSRRFLGPFLGVGVVSILMRLSGYAVISHFTATFLSDSGAAIDPLLGSIVLSGFRLFAPVIAWIALSRISMKSLFVATGTVSVFGMGSVAVYSHVLAVLPHASSSLGMTGLAWIPLVGSTLAYCCQDLGLLPVLYILLSEQFPTDIRTMSVGIVTGLQMLAMVLSVKMYPILVSAFAFHGAVYAYTAVAAAMTLWAAVMVRSTDGLSLVDVENMFDGVKTISVGIVAKDLGNYHGEKMPDVLVEKPEKVAEQTTVKIESGEKPSKKRNCSVA